MFEFRCIKCDHKYRRRSTSRGASICCLDEIYYVPSGGSTSSSIVQYNIIQYSTLHYSTVQYSTVLYCNVIQYSTVQYSTLYSIVTGEEDGIWSGSLHIPLCVVSVTCAASLVAECVTNILFTN